MKHPDATTIHQLIQKLEREDDISLKEADQIFSLFSKNSRKTILNPNSSYFDGALIESLTEWYEAVGEKIRKGKRGNFIFTIYLDYDKKFFNKLLLPARKALRERGKPEDSYNVITTDEKTHASFSSLFFSKNLPAYTSYALAPRFRYYETTCMRAGMFYYPVKTEKGILTISQFMKNMDNLSCCPVPVPHGHIASSFINGFFYVIAGAEVPQGPYDFDRIELKRFIIGSLMRRDNISCIAVSSSCFPKAAIFVEKDKAPFIKEAWNIPMDNVIEKTVQNNIISEKTAQKILKDQIVENFPTTKFMKACTEYFEQMVKMRIQWKSAQNTVENEEWWLEEIR